MDVLAGLSQARPGERLFAASFLRPPWGLRFADHSPLAIEVVVAGEAWLRPDGEEPLHLRAGDLGLVNGGGGYVLADAIDTEPRAVIYAPGRIAASGEPEQAAADRWRLPGPRSYGESAGTSTIVVRGACRSHNVAGRRLFATLPNAIRIPAELLPGHLTRLLQDEVTRDDVAGHDTVLDRLLDLLLVLALRAWLQEAGPALPGWYTALAHPAVGRALQAIHDHPERPWSVAALAREAGLSRAAFAAQFRSRVGQTPNAYLTGWRIESAAALLRDTSPTLTAIARAVGYSDGYALSSAFKRHTGQSPADYRREPDVDHDDDRLRRPAETTGNDHDRQ